MSQYATLKAAITAAIKQNGNNEITGNLLQQQLLAMVNSLGANYQYAGIATPATNPGTPDQNVFYIASTAGTYTNFNGLVLTDGEIAILKYNGAWSKDSTGAATQESVNQLVQMLGCALGLISIEESRYIGSANDVGQNSFMPFVLFEQDGIRNKKIHSLKVNIKTPGILTIVKCQNIQSGTSVSYTVVESFNVLYSGIQLLLLSTPIALSDDEYIGIGIPTDTAEIYYKRGASDAMRFYVNISGNWVVSNDDLSIGLLTDSTIIKNNTKALVDLVNSLDGWFKDVALLKQDIQPNREASVSYSPFILPESQQNIIRGRVIKKIGFYVYSTGTITFKKITGNVAVGAQLSQLEQEIIGTFTAINTGYNEYTLPTPIELNNDDWLAVGDSTDTGTLNYYTTSGNFFLCDNGNIFNGTGNLLITVFVNGFDDGIKRIYPGKTMGAIGDSITYGFQLSSVNYAWGKLVADALGMDYISYGINSSTIANVSGHNPMCLRVGDMAQNLDLVFLFGGTNDWQNDVPLGEQYTNETQYRERNTDNTTFYGALNSIMDALCTRYPDKQIYVITPLHRGSFYVSPMMPADNYKNGAGFYLSEYVDAIINVAKDFSIPVIDMYSRSLLNPNNAQIASLYFSKVFGGHPDLLHPNEIGHEKLAKEILLNFPFLMPNN